MMGVKVSLRVNPEIAELLHGEESQLLSLSSELSENKL